MNPQRLSIRNLAPHVDAALLKELIEAAGVAPKDVGAVHVARDKVPTVPGKKPKPGKSKGYAFAEFSSHACAMRVLRFANNNPELASYCVPRGKKTGKEVPRPIVAFVVEDHRKVALRQKREDDAKAKATAPLDGPSRKERRREKRIANRLEKKRARKGAEAPVPKAPKVVDDGLMRDRADDRAVEQVFDAAERKRDKKRRKKKSAGAGRRVRVQGAAAGLPRVAEEGRRRGRGAVVRVNKCVQLASALPAARGRRCRGPPRRPRRPDAVDDRPAVGFGAGAVDADVRAHRTLVETAVLRVRHVGGEDFDLIGRERLEDA